MKPSLFIAFCFIFVRVLLLCFSNGETSFYHNDTASYLQIAQNLLHGNGFSHCLKAPYEPSILRTPVYPVFLAIILFLFQGKMWSIIFIQILLDTCTALLIFRIGKMIKGEGMGYLAALFYAVNFSSAIYGLMILSESLFTLLLTLVVYIYLKGITTRRLVQIAILWALMVLCRPIALYLFPLVIMMIVGIKPRKLWLHVTIFAVISGMMIVSWMYRNKEISGKWVISEIAAYNLYATYTNAGLAGHLDENEEDVRERQLAKVTQLTGEQLGYCGTNYERLDVYVSLSTDLIRELPVDIVLNNLKAVYHSFLPPVIETLEFIGLSQGGKGTLAVLNREGYLAAWNHYFGKGENDANYVRCIVIFFVVVYWMLFLGFGLIGLFRLKRQEWRRWGILLGMMVILLILPGAAAVPRFMVPMIPIICLLSAEGIIGSSSNLRKRFPLRLGLKKGN